MRCGEILSVLAMKPWSPEQLEEASRGKVNGSCDDPPSIELKFWLEIARSRSGNNLGSFFGEVVKLIKQASQGKFDR